MNARHHTSLYLLQRAQAVAHEKAGVMGRILTASPRLAIMLGIVGVGMLAAPEASFAGSGGGGEGEEFEDVWDRLVGWTTGTLGRIIALTLILVGATMGVVRQSLITFVVGIAMGLGLYNAPTIIEAVMSGTLEHAPLVIEATIKNGLDSMASTP